MQWNYLFLDGEASVKAFPWREFQLLTWEGEASAEPPGSRSTAG
jgi:hypothetical protein